MCNDLFVYRCSICKQVVISPVELKNQIRCCERDMELLVPGTSDGSSEHHVPVFKDCDDCIKVKVGKEDHPMTRDHHIDWIALVTKKGIYIKYLGDTDSPKMCFPIEDGEEVCAVYCYCNIHGLWCAKC